MNEVYEKFYIYIKSSFGEREKKELYEYIWKNWGRKISFYIANIVPSYHYCFDDLYQEVMLKIYNNLHTFNPLHSFKAWVYTIARNHCLDFLKARNEKNLDVLRKTDLDRIPASTDQEKKIIQDDLFAKIEKFLQNLEPIDREISYLRFYEDLSYKDISRIVNMNINSVKSKVRLIKQRCKSHLSL